MAFSIVCASVKYGIVGEMKLTRGLCPVQSLQNKTSTAIT